MTRALTRITLMVLIGTLLAGCGASWRTTTYDPRRSCESFGGTYWTRDGTCHSGGA
jgi:hypothetical protein